MKSKAIISILAVVALGVVIALLASRKTISNQRDSIASLSNQVNSATRQVLDLTDVNKDLESNLAKRNTEYQILTNTHAEVLATLARTEKDVQQAEAALGQANKNLEERDARIRALESENKELDAKSAELTAAITSLTTQIESTRSKLASAEGDKALLQKELARLMEEKATLERKLTDLQFLKKQVAQLKAELSIAKRLEWIRKGLFAPDQKGASQLLPSSQPKTPLGTNAYDLNVEINTDGSVKIIPPPTNAPASK